MMSNNNSVSNFNTTNTGPYNGGKFTLVLLFYVTFRDIYASFVEGGPSGVYHNNQTGTFGNSSFNSGFNGGGGGGGGGGGSFNGEQERYMFSFSV
jgi:hypothetical protein